MTATEDRWTVEACFYKRQIDGWTHDVLDGHSVVCRVPATSEDDPNATAIASDIAASLNAEYARRALPDGVELHRDGSLWALGRDIPDGWERRVVDGKWFGPCAACAEAWYEVRPPQTPPTVRVQWWEALRDGREVEKGHPISVVEMHAGERRLSWVGGYDDGGEWWGGVVPIAADGTVEVLA